ncbi:MAG: dihydromethanopterin reductase (acceptor) [Candidatus Bathyarchaeia archaeon]
MIFLAWGVTGAGHFLLETFTLMREVAKRDDVKVTTYLTRAGEEVVKIYGLWNPLGEISDGGYYSEVLTEAEEGAGAPSAGRLARGVYRAIIVSPASANTVAKVRLGIADTVVTNAVAQALKSGTPVLILPTDQVTEEFETVLPHRVNREACIGCRPCPAEVACPTGALKRVEEKMKVQLTLCMGCGLCLDACPYGAIRFGERIRLKPRRIDVENVESLRKMEGLRVLGTPQELREAIDELLGGSRS